MSDGENQRYCIDASGGPYYEEGDSIHRGEVLGKDANGDDVVSAKDGVICDIAYDGNSQCFNIHVNGKA